MGGSRAICRAVAGAVAVALLAATGGVAAGVQDCKAITRYNVITLEDFVHAASVVEGPLAVGGTAFLKDVSVNEAGKCLAGGRVPDTVAMIVAGDVHATKGQIRAGKVLVGGRLDIRKSVDIQCARVKQVKCSLKKAAKSLKASHEDLCTCRSDGCRTSVDDASGVTFYVRDEGEAVCKVSARDLGRAKRVKITGRRRGQRVTIQVQGGDNNSKELALRDTDLYGFEPENTLLALCNVPTLVVDGVRIPAAVFAPRTAVIGKAGQIRGTAVLKSFAGKLAFRSAPYECHDDPTPSPEART